MKHLMAGCATVTLTGHKIWFYELPWTERRVTRPGYLFFGAPDERSTAQPPRDFYVYVLPPFLQRRWHDEERPDEVILQLTGLDHAFEEMVRLYAGARAMSVEAASHREVYAQKADDEYRPRLNRWLRDQLTEHLQVTYQGVSEPVNAVLARTRSTASRTIEELLQLVAAHLLAPEFEDRYPDYPSFPALRQPISEAARPTNAMEAIRSLAGRGRTNLATAVLEGLKLVDEQGTVRPYGSPYARHFLDQLQRKPEGQVVNRGEVIVQVAGGIQPIEKDPTFHLEPEWLAVILVALTYNGDVVLDLGGRQTLDASTVERAATMAIADLTDFRFYGRPRALPVNTWGQIFEGLGLSPGLIRDENSREQAVRELQRTVNVELERTAILQGRVQQGLQLWNTPLFTDRFTIESESGVVAGTDLPAVTLSSLDLLPHLRGYKGFLEELTRFNTVGRLRNLRLTVSDVSEALEHRQRAQRAEELLALVDRIQPLTGYLAEAQANLPTDHPWSVRAAAARQSLLDDVRRRGRGEDARNAPTLARELESLKEGYVTAYAELHRRLVLGPQADDRRRRLYDSPRLEALNTLARVDLLAPNRTELEGWVETISSLPTCRQFHEGAIADTPTCPHCNLRPAQQRQAGQSDQVLDQLDQRLDDMLERWRQALRGALSSETAQGSLAAMTPAERRPIEQFLAQSDQDAAIPEGFVSAATQALRGIQALTLAVDGLLAALREGGLPCTHEQLKQRFDRFVEQVMHGHDAHNTRLTLDR